MRLMSAEELFVSGNLLDEMLVQSTSAFHLSKRIALQGRYTI